MMDPVRSTLRLEILRAAHEQYQAMKIAKDATDRERELYTLFAMECELWSKEVWASIKAKPKTEEIE